MQAEPERAGGFIGGNMFHMVQTTAGTLMVSYNA